MAYSKHTGVTFDKRRNKWIANIKINGKNKFLGSFKTEEEAAARRLQGEVEFSDVLWKNKMQKYKNEVIRLYENGMKISQIANKFDKNYFTIHEHLISSGVTLRNDRETSINSDMLSILIEEYDNGESISNLSTKYNIEHSAIYDRIKSHTDIRPNRKYFLKDNRFMEYIDCEWKAYFLGLLYADGNMRKLDNGESPSISITLTEKDSYILEELSTLIYENHKPLVFCEPSTSTKRNATLSVHCKLTYDDLLGYGCHPCKSFTIEYPKNLPDEYFSHFLRGYFDGDGWFTNKATFGIIGSYAFCETIKDKLKDELNINAILRPEGKVCRLLKYRKDDHKKFGDFIYKDATIFLKRKRDRFNQQIS